MRKTREAAVKAKIIPEALKSKKAMAQREKSKARGN